MSRLSFPPRHEALMAEVASLFSSVGFGMPEFFGMAPGRVNVVGEHIDYNGGLVLPAAIDRWFYLALRPNGDKRVRLVSQQAPDEKVEFVVKDGLAPQGKSWGNFVKGVVAGLQAAGHEVPGFDAAVISTVPLGAGLSSSAALEAVFAKTLLCAMGVEMEGIALAKLCQTAEHDFAGVPCGLMDQAAVVLCEEGKLLMLDCVDDSFQHAPFDDPGWRLLIISTGVSHDLSDGGYAVRRDRCHAAASILRVDTLREVDPKELSVVLQHPELTEEMIPCVRHVVTEIARVQEAVGVLAKGDYFRLGDLLNASHVSLRDDYRVSCPELDFVAALAQSHEGVAGCRMTGGGFGGSAIALVRGEQVGALTRLIEGRYEAEFGFKPEIFETRPMGGAQAWRIS